MTTTAPPHDSPHQRIALLASQAFALGLTLAWIMIPASAIFLTAYGSDLLPVTYIAAAAAGVASSTLLAAAFRRRPLAAVAIRTLAGLSILLLASWLVLATSGADWVSFALLMLVPLMVPVGFIFVVGQAGMLLDVRALKALYARVVAGFAFGFVAGGLAGPPLLSVLGDTEGLLAAAAAAAGLFLALVITTRHRYPTELSVVEHPDVEPERPTLRALARNRYLMLIIAFQMLSAVESQWLDFLVLATAAARYSSSDELARFVSQFSVTAYGTDIAFLLLLAGLLLRRFGLRYGLSANSIAVLALVAAIIVATTVLGSGATLVFVLIVGARVADLTFSDGASRTSLSAAYQAVPPGLRAFAQTTVEGIAVPVAIGASGVGLLLLELVGGTGGLVLPILTGVVVIAWAVVAGLLYREYGVNLLANLRGRRLDPADLSIDSESNLVVIDRLVESEHERDVQLGLDILTIAEHPQLATKLYRLTADSRVSVRTDALERLVVIAPQMAAEAARAGLDDSSPDVRAASIRVLGAANDPGDLARIEAHRADDAADVRVAVAFALTRIGDDTTRSKLAGDIARLAVSSLTSDRILAARMAGEISPSTTERHALEALIADAEPVVAEAALDAFRWPDDAGLLDEIVPHIRHRQTSRAAIDALVRGGDAALVVIDEGLSRAELGRHAQELLARAARDIGGVKAIAVLHAHLDHHDREVGLAVMSALATLGPSELGSPDSEGVVRDDLAHATRVLRALVTFAGYPSAAVLNAALRDELDLLRRRILAAFSMRHATDGFNRVVFQLAQRDSRSHALALEWLDVTLSGPERAAVAVLEPGLSDRERMSQLTRTSPTVAASEREVLVDLVSDPLDLWRRPWLKACAIYTAGQLSDAALVAEVTAAALAGLQPRGNDDEQIVRETLASLVSSG